MAFRGVEIPAVSDTAYSGSGPGSLAGMLPAIKAMGATHVILQPIMNNFVSASNPVQTSDATGSIPNIITAIAAIQAQGLKAVFKVSSQWADGTDGESYAGTGGDNGAAFLTNYTAMLVTYAQMCQAHGVVHMEVCSEMDTLARANPAGYRSLIAAVRAHFGGTITYGATGWYYADITFWDACDYIGIHGYFDLVPAAQVNTSNLNVAAMTAYLTSGTQSNGTPPPIPTLAAMSASLGKQVLFTETGYSSIIGCAYQPWNSANQATHAVSQADQAAAYQAMLNAYTPQSWCAGINIWVGDWVGETQAQLARDYTPDGRGTDGTVPKTAYSTIQAAWA